MLQKKQRVPNQALLARIDHPLLHSKPVSIGDAAELEGGCTSTLHPLYLRNSAAR